MIQAHFVIRFVCFVYVCICDKLLLDFSGEDVFVQYTVLITVIFFCVDVGDNLM
jgi:hypothetical protein